MGGRGVSIYEWGPPQNGPQTTAGRKVDLQPVS